jgi:hypothetical protein
VGPVGQQFQAAREPGQQGTRRKDGDPGRRELEGQREPVQPPADLHHVAGILIVDDEGGRHRLSPVHEQADRTEPFQGGRRRQGSSVRERQRRHRDPLLAGETNATAANPISSVEATSMANRVLPTPPGPVSVTSRATRVEQQVPQRRRFPLAADDRGQRHRPVTDPCGPPDPRGAGPPVLFALGSGCSGHPNRASTQCQGCS